MDYLWERSIPVNYINRLELKMLFQKFQQDIEIINYRLVKIGARNSNYIVNTSKGMFFLRICPCESVGYKNELISYSLLKDIINMPTPLYIGEYKNSKYIIYEYISGASLQGVDLSDNIIATIAESIAQVHSLKKQEYEKYDMLKYPPFEEWIDLFLENENANKRLGKDLIQRVKKLQIKKQEEFKVIDLYKCFIHSDFRTANMIIDMRMKIYFVDWEYGNEGHLYGDIGQFFREKDKFCKSKIELFKKVYNQNADIKLCENWYELSKLRDLINPLQMIGGKEEAPRKYKDLIGIIVDTLEYFGE